MFISTANECTAVSTKWCRETASTISPCGLLIALNVTGICTGWSDLLNRNFVNSAKQTLKYRSRERTWALGIIRSLNYIICASRGTNIDGSLRVLREPSGFKRAEESTPPMSVLLVLPRPIYTGGSYWHCISSHSRAPWRCGAYCENRWKKHPRN